MQFGHNTNVTVGTAKYHVQTEDRGAATATIDTMVYWNGRVVHRVTAKYEDLLPLDAGKEAILKQRVDEQHRGVEEGLRSGTIKIEDRNAKPTAAPAPSPSPIESGLQLKLRIHNSADWLRNKQVLLKVGVRDDLGNILPRATVTAKMEGTAESVEVSSKTGEDGIAILEFVMPKFKVMEPSLILEASFGAAKGRMRLQLKAKAKVPTA